jgi:internalin A
MRKLFCLFSLFTISLSASAASEWLYYKHYPWVYDHHTKDWLYLTGSSDGEIYAYRSNTKNWEVFEIFEPTWEQKYEEWEQNPEPYGGLSVLQQIKEAKDSGATELDLFYRNISDLTPLAGLTNLTELHLATNNISDLTPLAGLTNLTYLNLSDNNISDLTPLSELTKLTKLYLHDNNISDSTPLAGLTNLTSLGLSFNKLGYITPLAELTNLTMLDLQGNHTDTSTKAMLEEALPNTNIIWPEMIIDFLPWDFKFDHEWIWNPEPYGGLDVLGKIKEAKDSGATELYLSQENISDLTPLAWLTNLTYLNLSDNNISDLTPLSELTKLTKLDLSYSNISDITPLAGLTNLTELSLQGNPITTSQKAMLEEALPNTNITWPEEIIDDRTWEEKYEEWIQNPDPYGGLGVLQQIKEAKDSGATYLWLVGYNITDITPLAELTNLEELYIDENNITDITPLAGLTNLTILILSWNNISDLSSLKGLTNLATLRLVDNNITDLTPLAELTNLTTLVLGGNNIFDLSPLKGLTKLTWLSLSGNNISDLTPITELTNLTKLYLNNNISASQKEALEKAMWNTAIYWID